MHAFHAGEQLARVEGLGHVVVGADFEADDTIDHVVRAGDHDDAYVVALTQVTREREPVFARQAHVEQHDVGQMALDRFAHVAAAFRLLHLVALRTEVLGDHFPDCPIVLDDQDGAIARHCFVPPGPANSEL